MRKTIIKKVNVYVQNWGNIKNVYKIKFESLKILILILILIHRIRYVLLILAFLPFIDFEI